MTVRELIAELSLEDPDAVVLDDTNHTLLYDIKGIGRALVHRVEFSSHADAENYLCLLQRCLRCETASDTPVKAVLL